MDDLRNILLETLSYYDPMTMEQILLQMDPDEVKISRDITLEDLEQEIAALVKEKVLKKVKKRKDVAWIKLFKRRRPWWKPRWLFPW